MHSMHSTRQQYHMVFKSLCVPPANIVLYGGQIIVHSTSQHCIIWWSDQHAFQQSTLLYGGQIIVHSTSQHCIIWWSDQHAFQQSTLYYMVVRSACTPQSTQYYMVVRSLCIPPVNTVLYGGQISMYSTSQHSIIWWSDQHAFQQSTQYYIVVRSFCIPPVNTVLYGGHS